jgi:cytochrome c oxidase subunit 3
LAKRDEVHALQHQFDDAEQQYEASSLGMWIFLATEVMFFGGMFAGYVVYRSAYPDAWAEGSRHLDITLGAVNTAVLIGSSLTMALAVRSAQVGRRGGQILFLLLTALLGSVFLGIKAVEYGHKFTEHLVPGTGFRWEGPNVKNVQLFYSFYFAMTGMHALHMVVGLGLLAVLVVMAWRRRFSPAYFTPVEITGLYWHFVDIIWIYLFPLLYLIDRHGH